MLFFTLNSLRFSFISTGFKAGFQHAEFFVHSNFHDNAKIKHLRERTRQTKKVAWSSAFWLTIQHGLTFFWRSSRLCTCFKARSYTEAENSACWKPALISKWMSNIYLKVTIEKNWRSQNFHFQSLKKFVSMSVFGNL